MFLVDLASFFTGKNILYHFCTLNIFRTVAPQLFILFPKFIELFSIFTIDKNENYKTKRDLNLFLK